MSDQPIDDSIFDDQLLTIEQVYRQFNVSRAYIYHLMAEGKLGYVTMGRCRRIPRKAMLEFLKANYRYRSQT